jgi:transcriptional regulator with XRE-family HTH domain
MGGRGRTVETARDRVARHTRALRHGLGISQEELADMAQLHRTYIGSIERSERNVSLDNVEKIAWALGVDVCELLAVA